MGMKHLFFSKAEDRADDLGLWAIKIKSLAKVLSLVADEKWEGNPPTKEEICDLADIISDYAEAIETVAEEAFTALFEFYRKGNNEPESILRRRLEYLKNAPKPNSTGLKEIDEILKELNVHLAKKAALWDLHKEFTDLRRERAEKVA